MDLPGRSLCNKLLKKEWGFSQNFGQRGDGGVFGIGRKEGAAIEGNLVNSRSLHDRIVSRYVPEELLNDIVAHLLDEIEVRRRVRTKARTLWQKRVEGRLRQSKNPNDAAATASRG